MHSRSMYSDEINGRSCDSCEINYAQPLVSNDPRLSYVNDAKYGTHHQIIAMQRSRPGPIGTSCLTCKRRNAISVNLCARDAKKEGFNAWDMITLSQSSHA
ncbi:hypothetical protein AG1IA_10222 [Rhizoctonia solani AG-1 IA]|uniref:Uncharacterized protein n=1 Tax=Thanatephorus cucumeris (strain AG1-IA) TaxID=983506 RepID=L8WG48_THACA|nr:hypothetical protein AG1IA_10222 [Rhizoctonia solani AG-1 IA]